MPEGDVEVAFGNGDSVQVSSQSVFFHSSHHLAGLVVWMTLEGPFLFKSVSSLLCSMLDGGHFVDVSSTWQMWNHQRSLSVLFWMFLDLGTSIGLGKKWGSTAQSESFSFEKASTPNFLMGHFVKKELFCAKKTSRDSTQTVLKHCQASSRRCQGMLLNMVSGMFGLW